MKINNTYIKHLVIFQICLLIYSSDCFSQVLDSSFGTNGKVLIPIENTDQGNSVDIQSDGKIIVGGYSVNSSSQQDLSIISLNTNGSLNTNFNSTGKKILSLTSNGGRCNSVKVSGTSIIAVGYTEDATTSYSGIADLDFAGNYNSTFNTNGQKYFSTLTNNDLTTSSCIEKSSGSIYTLANSYVSSSDISISKVKTDGNFDNAFNTTGKLVLTLGHYFSIISQSDGKVIICGNDGTNFSVIRLNSNGSYDNTFGTSGKVSLSFGSTNDAGYSLALQKDGQILVGGIGNSQFVIVRLNKTDGALDATFANNGKLQFSFGGVTDACNSITVDTFASANKILAVGYSLKSGVSNFATARIDLSGNIEAKAIESVGNGISVAKGVAIQSDSKVVVAGYASNGTDDDFAVIRLLPNFVTTGITETEVTINAGVNIFPNPTSYQLNIHSSYNISNIAIYNTLGELVLYMVNNNDVSSIIDISSLNKGVYTAVITTNKGNAVKKVVKQ